MIFNRTYRNNKIDGQFSAILEAIKIHPTPNKTDNEEKRKSLLLHLN